MLVRPMCPCACYTITCTDSAQLYIVSGVLNDHSKSTTNFCAVPHHTAQSAALCLATAFTSQSTSRAFPADESSHCQYGIPHAGPASRTDVERDEIYRCRAYCHHLGSRSQVILRLYCTERVILTRLQNHLMRSSHPGIVVLKFCRFTYDSCYLT